MILLTVFVTGLAMGLASSLHCAGMCGPIACAITFGLPREGRRIDAFTAIMLAQLGRVTSYTLTGAVFGAFGAGIYGTFNLEGAHTVLQWTAAISIVWTGLSVAGLVPAMAGLDRAFGPLAVAVGRLRGRAHVDGVPQLALAGLIWGLTPCAMVYTALLNAALSGSLQAGLVVMLGFGFGTVPAVTLSSFGLVHLRRVTGSRAGAMAAGGALVVFGVMGLLLTAPGSPLCITGA